MRRDHARLPSLPELFIQPVAIVRPVADQILGLGLNHVEVEAQLYQRDLMMIGRVRTHRERQSVAIHDRDDLDAFATPRRANFLATALGRGKLASMKHSRSSISPPRAAYWPARQNVPQYLASRTTAESDDAPFCRWDSTAAACAIARRCSESTARPQDFACWHRPTARAICRNVFLGEMLPNPFPLIIAQSQHTIVGTCIQRHNHFG